MSPLLRFMLAFCATGALAASVGLLRLQRASLPRVSGGAKASIWSRILGWDQLTQIAWAWSSAHRLARDPLLTTTAWACRLFSLVAPAALFLLVWRPL